MSLAFSNLIFEIQNVSEFERKNLEQLAMKTAEEVGELNQAVLSFTKAPGCAYKNKTRDDVDEEAIDVILCAFATLFRSQTKTNYDLCQLFQKKIDAWRAKMAKEAP